MSRWLTVAALALLAGCAIAKPRTDDPLEKYNREAYQFNTAVDKVAIRPVALVYRKVTNPPVRRSFSDFFTNIRTPVTVANDLLQARPKQALQSTARFLVNLTLASAASSIRPASSGCRSRTTTSASRWRAGARRKAIS
jgi:phospholipid-binding lipoprotein MlaA